MRVVAINGSPKGAASNTAVMIDALLDGFASNGDLVKSIVLSEKSIQYCAGCYTCWSTTPGVCIHNDDMKDIILEIRDTSILVIGTPLYFNNISGTLKVFFDRLTAAGGNPHEMGSNASERTAPSYVMVSNCGFPVRAQFDIVSLWINRVATMMKSAVIAELYATGGKVLTAPTAEQRPSVRSYLDYLKSCGTYLSKNMKLDKQRLDLSTRSILDFTQGSIEH